MVGDPRDGGARSFDHAGVRHVLARAAKLAPVLLVIDEFGKNLEAFADARGDADLYLLQQLAEWSRGETGIPVVVVTLQHMAFGDYAEGASVAHRREWTKIQGTIRRHPVHRQRRPDSQSLSAPRSKTTVIDHSEQRVQRGPRARRRGRRSWVSPMSPTPRCSRRAGRCILWR